VNRDAVATEFARPTLCFALQAFGATQRDDTRSIGQQGANEGTAEKTGSTGKNDCLAGH
jgi:hypothetical protein